MKIIGGVNFIFPNPWSDSIRTAVFADAGNVFDTNHVAGVSYEKVKLNNLRGSVGLMAAWNLPIGTMQFSVAKALDSWVKNPDKVHDEKQVFGFTLSQGF